MDFSQLKESPKLLAPLSAFLIRRNMVVGNQALSGIVKDLHYVYISKNIDLDQYKTTLKEKLQNFYILKAQIETKKLQLGITEDIESKRLILLDIVQLYEEIEYLSL